MRKVSIFIRSVLLRQSSGKMRGHWIHRIVGVRRPLCGTHLSYQGNCTVPFLGVPRVAPQAPWTPRFGQVCVHEWSQRRAPTGVPFATSLSPVAFGNVALIFVKRTLSTVNANESVTIQPAFESLPGSRKGGGVLEIQW